MPVPSISAPVSYSERSTWLSLTAAALTAAASVCLGLLTVSTSQHFSSTEAQFGMMESKMDKLESSLENKMDKLESSLENKMDAQENEMDQMVSSTRAQLDMLNMRARLQDLRAHCLSDSLPDDPKSWLFSLKATNFDKLKTEEDVLRLELHLRMMQKARGKIFDAVEEVRSWLDHVGK
eukprot:contig_4570_g985